MCPIQVHFLCFNLLPDAVLVCPPRGFCVCDLVLLLNSVNVSETFVYECLELSGCCLGYSLVLLVTLLLPWLLSVSQSYMVTTYINKHVSSL